MKAIFLSLILSTLLSVSGAAQASLFDRGGGLIYDSDLDITWLQDANYAKTSGYDADGLMNHAQAVSWAANLSYFDSVRNQTLTGWRLPSMVDTGTPGCNWSYSGTDCGFNPSTASELVHLFYNELGNLSFYTTSARAQPGWGPLNTGPFVNIQNGYYWYSTSARNGYAWLFDFGDGHQDTHIVSALDSGWAVRSGDVAAVPVPAAVWLLGSGLLGLVGVARRKQ